MTGARAAIGLVVIFLSACGFDPLYGARDGVSVVDELATVRIPVIGDRSGQILRNHLLDNLSPRGAGGPAKYWLEILLDEPRLDLAFRRDDTISRIGYSAVARYRLIDDRGAPVFNGSSSSTTSYEVTDSQYATLASRNNARDRVLEQIAEDIRQRLAVFFIERRARPDVRTPTS